MASNVRGRSGKTIWLMEIVSETKVLLNVSGKIQSGFASLLIILLLAVISGTGIEIYIKANAENRMVKREAQGRQAVYAAEGGIEWAKNHLDNDSSWAGGLLPWGENNYIQVDIEQAEGGYWVTSNAGIGLANRKIKVYLYKKEGKWSLSHYEELHS